MAGKVFQIWLGLCFSIVTIVLLGLEVAFNVYAVHLKKAFNFTQTEGKSSTSGIIARTRLRELSCWSVFTESDLRIFIRYSIGSG